MHSNRIGACVAIATLALGCSGSSDTSLLDGSVPSGGDDGQATQGDANAPPIADGGSARDASLHDDGSVRDANEDDVAHVDDAGGDARDGSEEDGHAEASHDSGALEDAPAIDSSSADASSSDAHADDAALSDASTCAPPSGACTPADCEIGVYACELGAVVCKSIGLALNGSPCAGGTRVCENGACVGCGGAGQPCCQGDACAAPGTCGSGKICTCVPSCAGKACGASDGCGGICTTGACGAGTECVSGSCVCDAASCGGGCCSAGRCVSGYLHDACGSGGNACTTCTSLQICGTARSCDDDTVTVFGGSDSSTFVNDTWTWGGSSWNQATVPGPSPREAYASAMLNGKLVLFGGYQLSLTNELLADTFEWDGATWRQRFVSGPPARAGAMAATLNGKVVLFGGFNNVLHQTGSGWTNDTWEWDGNAWTERVVPGPPAAGKGAMATLNGKVILSIAGQTWEWNGSTWSLRDFNAPAVSAPMMTTFANTIVLFGGEGTGGCSSDTWVWNDVAWTKLNVPGTLPPARSGGLLVSWHGRPLLRRMVQLPIEHLLRRYLAVERRDMDAAEHGRTVAARSLRLVMRGAAESRDRDVTDRRRRERSDVPS